MRFWSALELRVRYSKSSVLRAVGRNPTVVIAWQVFAIVKKTLARFAVSLPLCGVARNITPRVDCSIPP